MYKQCFIYSDHDSLRAMTVCVQKKAMCIIVWFMKGSL